jgi:hypothetical protein
MRRWFKFVAFALVMTLGGIPVLAAAPCPEKSEPGMHCCPPGCPMMAHSKAAPVAQFGSEHPASPCCDLHSGKPTRTSELQVPSATGSIAPLLSTIAFVATTKFVTNDESLFRLPNPGSHQALLCTFLI